MANTSAAMRRPFGTILEAEGEGYENSEIAEESPVQNQPSSMSPLVETSFPYDQISNTSYSFTLLQPTPHIPYVNIPFGTISTSKKKQPFEPSKPSLTIISEQPQNPKTLISQLQSQPLNLYNH